MKKFFIVLLCCAVLCGVLVGCDTQEAEDKTYDSDFIAALVKGCEERWDYADSEAAMMDDEQEMATTATNIELEEIKEYADLPFADTVLKEKALAYINELNNGLDILSTYGADAFYENWDAHYDHRTQLLVEINEISPLPFGEKYQAQFNELANRGVEVIESNEKEKAANELLSQFQFTALEPEYEGQAYITYEATVENITDYDFETFGVAIDLVDSDGVVVDTQYCYVENWTSGKKVKTEFATDVQFESLEINLDYYM
jgi:hypothetical protein